jgi:hypothetical protein
MNVALVDPGVADNLLDVFDDTVKQIFAELLKFGTGDNCFEVDTLKERDDFDIGLETGRKSTLGSLTGSAETIERTRV